MRCWNQAPISAKSCCASLEQGAFKANGNPHRARPARRNPASGPLFARCPAAGHQARSGTSLGGRPRRRPGGAANQSHGFRFRQAAAPPLDLVLTDTDAANWADAIDAISSLSTAHGISICLRLMALYELMATRPWAREWFTLSRGGLEFHPALLQAAALSPLTPTGGFAETSLQALLPAANYPADSRQTTPAGSRQTYPAGSRQPLGASRKI
jgi:hypothetical protein